MKRWISLSLLTSFTAIATLSANSCALMAQPNPTADVATATNRISINVVVTDKKGQPVRDLQASDFTVSDNKEPKQLLSFRQLNEDATRRDPVHVVIVVDMINTGASVVAREREQLNEFLKQNSGELANPTTIATFAESGAKVDTAFSLDGNALTAAFKKQQNEIRFEGRDNGFWGAADRLRMSLKQLGELLSYEDGVPGHKLIVVIGPGWPLLAWAGVQADSKQRTQVFNSIVQITNDLRKSDVALYCIDPFELGRSTPFYYQNFVKAVSTPKDAEYPHLALQVLAEHSGGKVFTNGADILGGLNTAVRDPAASYEITFESDPGDRPNEYHAIDVRVNRPNLIVRTVEGYYAHPQILGR